MRLNKVSLWTSALLVLGGCPQPPEEKPKLSAVSVTCTPTSVVAGEPSQCTASAADQSGKPFTVSGYTWTSSNESVATVDSTGKATTLTAGASTLSASATVDGITQQGQATLTVTPQPPRLSTVTVTCEPASVSAGRSSQCTASATDQYGKPFTVSGYTWTSSNESVATVGSTGRATTFSTGAATLRANATVGGVTQQGQAELTVTAAQPTLHSTPITADETWRAADNPHVVQGTLELGGASAPKLTLEAGVQLRFELDSELRVTTGALRALGTEEAPIHMTTNPIVSTKGYWRGVVFVGGGSTSEMNHVILNGCGRNTGESACIAMKSLAAPVLRHVTAQNSSTAGVAVADDGSAFGAESTTLNVSGSEGYAVLVSANQASTLPTGGTFTSNVSNAIKLQGNVSRSQTWPNLDIPYVVTAEIHVRDATTPPTLTLSSGTVLRFGSGSAFFVGSDTPGGLVVNGTATAPVVFTADSASPLPGHWKGVHLVYHSSSPSSISHAVIEYAGASGGLFWMGNGNLNLYGNDNDAGSLIKDVVVQRSSQSGLYTGFGGNFGPGSTQLTARHNGGYAISAQPNQVHTIPEGITLSDNARNVVEVREGNMLIAQTWPSRSYPYVITGWIELAAALTLSPGTEIRFGPVEGLISVGGDGIPGALIAMGTAEAPIRFVPDETPPTKGYWNGLHFYDAGGSRLDHVIVTHAGGTAAFGTGNVNVYREIGAFVTNSMFSDASGCGLTRSDGTRESTTLVTTDFTLATYNNTFVNNTGGAQCTN
ncbi:hypothetical protein BO221_25615 [Archangium sp. Cb G35]|uniref:hypothetical protein n=1 Tax=Archangium sp. Cb G35 TaxID=1920190 RepID=UPI000936392A|nr:hypothetical protein [Archangium sp. Cb G35]OJT22112.1 hypothetical protein BO221_25615 [Archangium sp. Cb G35]